jgi:hypothetical protein
MKQVSESLQKDKRTSNLDAPTGYGPFGRFHKRNPNPSPREVAAAVRAAKRRQFTPPIAAE